MSIINYPRFITFAFLAKAGNNILKANCYKKRKLKNQSKGQEQIQVQILTQKALRINFKFSKTTSSYISTIPFLLFTFYFSLFSIVNNFPLSQLK